MSSDDPEQRLRDVIKNIDRIIDYVGTGDFDAFVADQRTVDATERCLERIAEAVVKLGSAYIATVDPAIPFERVRGMGNMLRHAYDDIQERLIFNLVKQELPRLRAACAAALDH